MGVDKTRKVDDVTTVKQHPGNNEVRQVKCEGNREKRHSNKRKRVI